MSDAGAGEEERQKEEEREKGDEREKQEDVADEPERPADSDRSPDRDELPRDAEKSSADPVPHVAAEGTEKGGRPGLGSRSPRRYLLWAAFLLSLLLALIAALSLYVQVGSLIGIWIAPEYQPVYRAGFNLAVLLLSFYAAMSFARLLGVGE